MSQEKPKKNGKDAASARTMSFTVSVGKATALGILAVFVVAWAFVLGVVVGRGYRPEQAMPEIERIMPAPPAQNQTADLGVLKPEELSYMDQLSKTPHLTPKAAQAAKEAKEASEKAAREAAQKAAQKTAKAKKDEVPQAAKPARPEAAKPDAARPAGATAQKAVPATPAATPAPAAPMKAEKSVQQVAQAPQNPKPALADAPGQRFAYVYQVAAVDTPAGAQALVAKIKSTGLFATVEPTSVNGKTWHRVLVQFRGTPEETRDMKERLSKVGLDRAIMKSKNPL